LHLVAYQLELFSRRALSACNLFTRCASPNDDRVNDNERDKRTGSQWLKAVLAYLEFRTGDSWRRLSDPAQRWSPDRIWYLNGIGAIYDVMHGRVPVPDPSTDKKLPQPVRRATPGRRREDRCA
jgi:hypothetical protein